MDLQINDARPLPDSAGLVDERMLAASRKVVGFLVKENSTDFSVALLAQVAGLSERTYYRYFPRKEDVIRPALLHGDALFVDLLAARRNSEPLLQSIIHAFGHSEWAQRPVQSRILRQLVHDNSGMLGVWLQVIAESEISTAKVLGKRLGVQPGSRLAKLAASVVFVAIRHSVEAHDDCADDDSLRASFAKNMELIGSHIFT